MDTLDLMTERWILELQGMNSPAKVMEEYATMVRALVRTHPTAKHQDRTFPRIAALTDAVDDILDRLRERAEEEAA